MEKQKLESGLQKITIYEYAIVVLPATNHRQQVTKLPALNKKEPLLKIFGVSTNFFLLKTKKLFDFLIKYYLHFKAFSRVSLKDHKGPAFKTFPSGNLTMVGVAQLVERQVVALLAAGSSPVTHPIFHGAIV